MGIFHCQRERRHEEEREREGTRARESSGVDLCPRAAREVMPFSFLVICPFFCQIWFGLRRFRDLLFWIWILFPGLLGLGFELWFLRIWVVFWWCIWWGLGGDFRKIVNKIWNPTMMVWILGFWSSLIDLVFGLGFVFCGWIGGNLKKEVE